MIRAMLAAALGLSLVGCLTNPPDEDRPETRIAVRTDGRCFPGGYWNDSLGACEYPDYRPPLP